MMNSMNIPMGFRFDPSDEELIGAFLYARVQGVELPWNGIVEKELYGEKAAPWEVLDLGDASMYWESKREGGATKSTTYAFTTLTKASKKRISRRAGRGTWSGQTGPRDITSSATGEIIGHMRMLWFQPDTAAAAPPDLGHWIMHEYYLSEDMVRMSGGADLVLCRITKIIKTKKRPTTAAEDIPTGGSRS